MQERTEKLTTKKSTFPISNASFLDHPVSVQSVTNVVGSNSSVLQFMLKVPGTDYVQAAPTVQPTVPLPNPLPPINTRQVMVKDKEPAALYIRMGATVPPVLAQLGISVKGAVADPLAAGNGGNPAAHFLRFGQSRIPLLPETGQIQPKRSPAEKDEAVKRYELQRDFLTKAVERTNDLLQAINAGGQAMIAAQAERIKGLFHQYYTGMRLKRKKISMAGIGSDIYLSMLALTDIHNITNQNDQTIIAEKCMEELQLRLAQVHAEMEEDMLALAPRIPTGCSASAHRRRHLSALYGAPSLEVEAGEILQPDGSPYRNMIGWNYHKATQIPNALSPDALFLEDAVGKSSSDVEGLNAHWSAHIYGVPEQSPTIALPIPAPIAMPAVNAAAYQVIPSQCRFNQLQNPLKTAFFGDMGIHNGDNFLINYKNGGDQGGNVLYGHLRAARNGLNFELSLINAAHQALTDNQMIFLRDMADGMLDDLMIQYQANRAYRQRQGLAGPYTESQTAMKNKMNVRLNTGFDMPHRHVWQPVPLGTVMPVEYVTLPD